ncbi:uncharacterized protein N7483_002916 [Penicillium malachiteum]|uniref:uncharacterized protein n=1 Tax=Penicillium malachiteum TaxID=1324776 RepID=UPI002546CC03|nr:uncharacterized protein N7483_002916 [Penicillium malachiteum]KAJ5737791.1 hypothetical protein N7483_002916 [Penicillium malachiteum]
MLTKLPSELLDMVIDQISSRGDLKRLCEVCGHLYGRTMPYLYRRSLTLSAPNLSLDDLAVAFEGISREYSRYTKDLGFNIPAHLIAPGYREGFPRCVHKSSDGVADPFSILNLALSSPSLRFPADQLETFRWEVPTCIPSNLFCGNDAFLRNQRNIRSITLITDSICPANVMTQNAVDLVQFKKLQSLNWKGLNPFGNYKALSACIKAHGHQIRSLTLDILSDIHEDHKWLRSYLVHEEGLTLPAVYPP